MKKPSLEERKELGAFLSSRRGRLQPGELGLPIGQRRTPGLRREEVALLAGVSVSWYTWLEQGRDIGVSAAVLERLSSVLRLDRAESAHLFALSSRQPSAVPTFDEPSDGLLYLVQAIDPVPAYVRNSRLDILAWNPAVADLFVDYGGLELHERNTLRLLFLYPPYRSLIRDWEQVARGTIRVFHAARAKASDKTPFDRLAEEIRAGNEEFRVWWPQVGVQGFGEGEKRLRHPTRGLLDLTYVALVLEGRPDLSLVTYIPRPGTCDRES
jgi:transcriptional regulator with XRE-family HTH domain